MWMLTAGLDALWLQVDDTLASVFRSLGAAFLSSKPITAQTSRKRWLKKSMSDGRAAVEVPAWLECAHMVACRATRLMWCSQGVVIDCAAKSTLVRTCLLGALAADLDG